MFFSCPHPAHAHTPPLHCSSPSSKPHFKQLFALKGNYTEGFRATQHPGREGELSPAPSTHNLLPASLVAEGAGSRSSSRELVASDTASLRRPSGSGPSASRTPAYVSAGPTTPSPSSGHPHFGIKRTIKDRMRCLASNGVSGSLDFNSTDDIMADLNKIEQELTSYKQRLADAHADITLLKDQLQERDREVEELRATLRGDGGDAVLVGEDPIE